LGQKASIWRVLAGGIFLKSADSGKVSFDGDFGRDRRVELVELNEPARDGSAREGRKKTTLARKAKLRTRVECERQVESC
jgi:hypothetical protein